MPKSLENIVKSPIFRFRKSTRQCVGEKVIERRKSRERKRMRERR